VGFIVFLSGSFSKKPGWVFWVVFFYNNPASRRSLEYVRSRFTLAHLLEPELPSAISIFSNIIHITLSVFLKQWICIEH